MIPYQAQLEKVRQYFARTVQGHKHLFETNATGLWDTYLAGFADAAQRQEHNCRACRVFIENYGHLVTLTEDGQMRSAVWDAQAPGVIGDLARCVEKADVTGVFFASARIWGTPKTGEWEHLYVSPPADVGERPSLILNADQNMALSRENYRLLVRLVDGGYSPEILQAGLQVLQDPRTYRAAPAVAAVTWLQGQVRAFRAQKSVQLRDRMLWSAVASAPQAVLHIRTSPAGALLKDLEDGAAVDVAIRKYNAMMDPSQYQRAQAAPKAGTLAAAEKLFEQLRLAPALDRRYARLAELDLFWQPSGVKDASNAAAPASSTVFGHLKARQPAVAPAPEVLPITPGTRAKPITWDKFQRTVLPQAVRLEVLVPPTPRWAALVTAVDPKAPPILRWDEEENRNPISWYYEQGADAGFRQRVEAAGGQYTNVDIRATLIWENRNDLDLHVVTPKGFHIFYGAKQAPCGGYLDVDMNVRGETNKPVENIRWGRGKALPGEYCVEVKNFSYHESGHYPTPFRVELEVNGHLYYYQGTVPPGEVGVAHRVVDFGFRPGERPVMRAGRAKVQSDLNGPAETGWGILPGAWVPVTGLTAAPGGARHIFWLLQGCQDRREEPGRGFFPEMLREELRPVRAVLEAHTAEATLAGREEADACGLGFSDQSPWNLQVRVTSDQGTNLWLIDRWD